MTDSVYEDYIALQANTLSQAESLLHSLEQATGSSGFYVNVNKTEFMNFKQEGGLSTASGKPLKLEDKFVYLGSNISSTENYVNIRLVKAWTAIDRLSVRWKFDLYDIMKLDFF